MNRTAVIVMLVVVLEIVALWVIYRLWRSPGTTRRIERIALSLLALVPLVGPLLVLWIHDDPGPAHPVFRDNARFSTEVLDRWRHVFDEPDPEVRQKKWEALMARYGGGPP
jgi:hypothetical protein